MPKLPVLKPKELIKIVQQLGFIIDRQKGSHVILYHKTTRRRVIVPLHVKDLPNGTLLSIIRDSGFEKEEFIKKKN